LEDVKTIAAGATMYLSKNESKRRLREAERARDNRLEIVSALSQNAISRRDLFRWGLLTATGALVAKNGLSPFATSAFADVPTGAPPSPLFGAKKFTRPMPRNLLQKPIPLVRQTNGDAAWQVGPGLNEHAAKNYSYHTDFDNSGRVAYRNPVTGIGPMEGRPPGPFFAHQRWEEFHPKVGYVMSIGQCEAGTRFCYEMPELNPNALWSFGPRATGLPGSPNGQRTGYAVPCLFKARYGEPVVTRIYNDLPVDRSANGGFGRNEISTHLHNAHNGAESDGACNAYHFPGTFYDYHWSFALARRDMPSIWATNDPDHLKKASGPDNEGGLVQVAGDFRELQGSLWLHDHRFFFTAENVQKGMFANCNLYSGPDRGSDQPDRSNVNLRLPSGNRLSWGNLDFDVNLAISNPALDKNGQPFFDVFDTDGFVGDMLLVNGTYYPYFEVLPRRYRFRILNASMARFIKLALAVNKSLRFARGTAVPFHFIANDGNLVVTPVRMTQLEEQGVGERYDIVIDFSAFRPGDSLYFLNLLKHSDGRKPDGAVSVSKAFKGEEDDPCVGPVLEFRVVYSATSVDDPSTTYTAESPDPSVDLSDPDWATGRKTLTTHIPIVAPVRERVFEWGRSGSGDSRDNPGGQCIPECGDIQSFPWTVRVNGQSAHTLNANRISALIPKPGEVEHWTMINGGGGWDHPIHLHFEEGVTINRGLGAIGPTELLARKDVWRLRPDGRVKFQVRFGEFGGSYVTHCHNTIHEDFAMLLRYQLLSPPPGDPDYAKTGSRPHHQTSLTPIPSPAGVTWKQPEILPEADPNNSKYFPSSRS
jgi:FtsP/CotA-like multicopper oxidase with cupredoxin domain